jgi:hypothetical protein
MFVFAENLYYSNQIPNNEKSLEFLEESNIQKLKPTGMS